MDFCFGMGCNRSGQTSLLRILNTHPSLSLLNEIYFTIDIQKEKLSSEEAVSFFVNKYSESVKPATNILGGIGTLYYKDIFLLSQCFPQSKFLHVRRSLMGLVDAFIFDSHQNDYLGLISGDRYEWVVRLTKEIAEIVDKVERAIHYVKSQGHLVMAVDFEDMADDPYAVIESISSFLEVDYDNFDLSIIDDLYYNIMLNKWKKVPEIVRMKDENLI